MTRTSLPVVLYGRVSLVAGRQEKAKSVDDQLAELLLWAQREGWPVLGVFRDDGVSASRYAHGRSRQGWEQTVAMIQSGQLRGGALLVWELSRASRDKRISAALEQTCADAGVKIGYHGRLHDPSTADGGFGLGLDALLAARESDMTSERTRRAVNSRAADGRPHGRVPFGYRRTIDPETGHTLGREIHPEQGPIVREIVTRLLAQEPAYRVAKDLNARQIRPPRSESWAAGNMTKMVLSPSYAGLRVHQGEVQPGVVGTWPALLSLSEHRRLVAMYSDPSRDKHRHNPQVRHLGSGLYRCGRDGCTGRMRVTISIASTRARRYSCSICHGVQRKADPVDEHVQKVVVARLSRPDALAAFTEVEGPDVERIVAEIESLRADIDEAMALHHADGLSLRSFADIEKRKLAQIAERERQIQPREAPPALVAMAGRGARERWEAASIEDRRVVLEALCVVTIMPTAKRGRGFDRDSVVVEPA